MIRPAATKINLDHWGFYEVGQFKLYSKLEAIEISKKIGQPVKFNFNKAVFDTFDWTTEPSHTLDHWYSMRAHQIRDKYDYIVLFYSGGADSYNMLMTFVQNGIYIDEIAQFHCLEAYNGDKRANWNAEVFATSIPNTQKLIETNPLYKNTVHRVLDLTDWETKVLRLPELKWDWFYHTNNWFGPWTHAISTMHRVEHAWQQLADKGRKVCFLFGVDKPSIVTTANKFFVRFSEITLSVYANNFDQRQPPGWYCTEGFYWTPDLPEIVCKQAHIVKRFMLNLTPEMIDHEHVMGGQQLDASDPELWSHFPRCETQIDGHWYALTDKGLDSTIYSYRTPDAIVCEKSKSTLFGTKDDWLWNKMAPDLGQKRYQKSVVWFKNYVRSLDPDWWWEHKGDPKKNRPFTGGLRFLYNYYAIDGPT